MMLKLLGLLVLVLSFSQLTDAKCLQKNTLNREAHRDVFRCDNQLFEEGTKQADPEECQCYYHCNYRQQPCYYCCPDGQVFSAKLNSCVHSSAYRCRDQPAKFKCSGAGKFANKEHCRKYWDCSNPWAMPVEEACAKEQHWDDNAKLCRNDSEGGKYNRCDYKQ